MAALADSTLHNVTKDVAACKLSPQRSVRFFPPETPLFVTFAPRADVAAAVDHVQEREPRARPRLRAHGRHGPEAQGARRFLRRFCARAASAEFKAAHTPACAAARAARATAGPGRAAHAARTPRAPRAPRRAPPPPGRAPRAASGRRADLGARSFAGISARARDVEKNANPPRPRPHSHPTNTHTTQRSPVRPPRSPSRS